MGTNSLVLMHLQAAGRVKGHRGEEGSVKVWTTLNG